MTVTSSVSEVVQTRQRPLTALQLVAMNLGFAGVQMAWGLQMANASSIFESLGATASQIPILWLAAPMTGLIIQPVVGYWSDRTQSPLGKRRPYFLVGGLIGTIALIGLPFAGNLAIATSLIWLLDIFVNVAMTPFRSFVVDVVPEPQRTLAFTTQSFSHGFGAFLASLLPWCLLHLFHFQARDHIDPSVQLSLWIGAGVFGLGLIATVVFAPPDLATHPEDAETTALSMKEALMQIPPILKQLSWVQSFSWMGIFCVFLYFPPAVAHNIFGATSEFSPQYAPGIAWSGVCFALFNLVCVLVSLGLSTLAKRFALTELHGYALVCGSVSLMLLPLVHTPILLALPMVGLGLAWASMLSIPYALLSDGVPESLNGFYMGLFNCLITLPQILVSLGLGWILHQFLGGDRMLAVALGGVLMGFAAIQSFRISAKP